jgi:hypothetical protein
LLNTGNDDADISGWVLGDFDNPQAYVIPQNTVLAAWEGTLTFSHSILPFEIDDSGETIYLWGDAGILIATWSN